MTSNNIKEWLSEADQAAKDYQEDCIDTIVTDINWELMSNDYEFEDHYIGEYIHEYCETKVIYTYDCKKIIDELSYDVFADDPMTGERANSLAQAAYLALEGALYSVDIETIIKSKLNLNKDG
jgi:hypothetical protein